MTEKNPTCIRVQPGANNATVTNCTQITSQESRRSLVETSAKNTKVIGSKIIELPKIVVKHAKHHKLLWGIIVPFVVAVAAIVTGHWLTGSGGEHADIKTDIEVMGDYVQGDKLEVHSDASRFKKLSPTNIETIETNLRNLISRYPQSPFRVLLNYYDMSEGTQLFVSELKHVMQKAQISFKAVPVQIFGLEKASQPLTITYDGITAAQARDYALTLSPFFSGEHKVNVVFGTEDISGDYNLFVGLERAVYFDSDGRVFFSE